MISLGLRNYSKAELALSKIEMDTEQYTLSVRGTLKSLLCPSPMGCLNPILLCPWRGVIQVLLQSVLFGDLISP